VVAHRVALRKYCMPFPESRWAYYRSDAVASLFGHDDQLDLPSTFENESAFALERPKSVRENESATYFFQFGSGRRLFCEASA